MSLNQIGIAKNSSDSPDSEKNTEDLPKPDDLVREIREQVLAEIRAEAAAEEKLKELARKLPKGTKFEELGESAVERLAIVEKLVKALPEKQRGEIVDEIPQPPENRPHFPKMSERSADFHKAWQARRKEGKPGILIGY